VDERIYYALEQHFLVTIGPDALPYLINLLQSREVEGGVKRSALNTLGRLSKHAMFRVRLLGWLPEFIRNEVSDVLVSLAESILEACRKDKPFSVLMCLPNTELSLTGIIPRSAGAPIRRRDDDDGTSV
jgi:hypothetical protein